MGTKNDEMAAQVSQSGPYFDGQDVQKAATGEYDNTAKDAAVRNQSGEQDKSKSPFTNIRSGK